MEPNLNNENTKPDNHRSRPVILSIFCLFGFVYFALLALLFILATFYSGWITEVTNNYVPAEAATKAQIFLLFFSGALLHLVAFAGLILLWKMRRTGYYLLGVPCLAVACYHLFQPGLSISTTLIYILFIIIFGFFFRRLR